MIDEDAGLWSADSGASLDDLTCDFDSLPRKPLPLPDDPWLVRRLMSFGASEIYALLIALGDERPTEATPGYTLKLARKLIGLKVLRRLPEEDTSVTRAGKDVEIELLEEWSRDPFNRFPRGLHASITPPHWYPLIDRFCPRLSCTPDAWSVGPGDNIQIKTDRDGELQGVTRGFYLQVQTEMAVLAASRTLIVYGPGWACTWANKRRPPITWVVERDEECIAAIRSAARRGWKRVDQIWNENGGQ